MPDKWGRPTMSDWMGMVSTIQNMQSDKLTRGIKEATLADKQRASQRSVAEDTYANKLFTDPEFRPDETSPDFDAKAWQGAALKQKAFENKKMEFDAERINMTYDIMGQNLSETMPILNEAKIKGDTGTYRNAYESLLTENYDLINNEYDFVKDTFDWEKGKVKIKNHVEDREETIDIPDEQEVRRTLGNFYTFKGSIPGMTDDGRKNFLVFGLGTDEKMKNINRERRFNAEVWKNDKGETLYKWNPLDFRGTGEAKTAIEDEKGNAIEGEEAVKKIKEAGFKPLEQRGKEADIEKKEATADYYKSYTRGAGSMGKEIKTIAKIKGVSEQEALELYRQWELEDKTISTRLNKFAEEAEWIDRTTKKGEQEYQALAKRWRVEDQVLTPKDKIQVSGGPKGLPKQRKVVKTGMHNGKKVKMFSDGSIEYAD